MVFVIRLFVLACCLGFAPAAAAAPPADAAGDSAAAQEQAAFDQFVQAQSGIIPQAWEGNLPNFLGYVWDKAEPHPQFFLSMKYPLRLGWGRFAEEHRPTFNLAYTGLEDFYLAHRYSSPIVSRLQNPGIFFDLHLGQPFDRDRIVPKSVELGWWHESNGQTLDSAAQYQNFMQNSSDHAHPQDYVSMGWDNVDLNLRWEWFPRVGDAYTRLKFSWEGRLYTGRQGFFSDPDQNVFWGPDPHASFINWYDGVRLHWLWESGGSRRHGLGSYWSLGVDLQGGNSPEVLTGRRPWLVSAKYSATVKLWAFPLTAFYFDGWGPYLSDYMDRNSLFGLGMKFLISGPRLPGQRPVP